MSEQPTTTTPTTTPATETKDSPRKKAWATRRANADKRSAPKAKKEAPAPTAAEKYRERLEIRLSVVDALEQMTPEERAEVLAAVSAK